MVGGCTVVATFLKNGGSKMGEVEDVVNASDGQKRQQHQQQQKLREQLHILPAYSVLGAMHAKQTC